MSRHLSVLLTTTALTIALAPAAAQADPAAAQADPHLAVEAWTADLSTIDDDDVNVAFAHGGLQLAEPAAEPSAAPASVRGAGASGMLVLPPRTLAMPANRVYAEPAVRIPAGAAVDVDVRGLLGGGWTEWLAATVGAVFAAPVTEVQARITLSARRASPTVTALRLTADTVQPTPATIAAAAAVTYWVFATREGLVGTTTGTRHRFGRTGRTCRRVSRRPRPHIRTGTTAGGTSSGARCSTRPGSTSPTARSGMVSCSPRTRG